MPDYKRKNSQLNIVLDPDLDSRFRILVGQVKGAKKGALAEAVQEALEIWIEKQDKKFKK